MDYLVVIEKTGNGFSAYVPDLPGCVVAGDTVNDVAALIRDAVGFHVESLIEDGEPIPPPDTTSTLVRV